MKRLTKFREMAYIKNKSPYTEVPNTKESIEQSLKEFRIGKHTINDDLTVDVHGGVYLKNRKLDRIPFQFGIVKGNFNVYGNQLTSLEGCPREVGGNFDCSNNKLTSLKYCPIKVGGNFYAQYNGIKLIENNIEAIDGNFILSSNQLTSLKGCPKEVGGGFVIENNNLTSLEGAPESVGGSFKFSYNKLTSLEGAPESVGGNFSGYKNSLTSIKGLPKKITGQIILDEEMKKFFPNEKIEIESEYGGAIMSIGERVGNWNTV